MEEALPLTVDEQQPAFDVLDVDHGGGVVEDLLQAGLAVFERRCTRVRSAMSSRSRVCVSATSSAMASKARPAGRARRVPLRPLRAPRLPAASCSAALHQPRGAPGQQEVKHQPHGQRQRRHPSRPVERLLEHLRARFRLVPLEIVDEEQAAGARRTQLLALAAHQDAGVAEQLVAVRVDRHPGTALANRTGGLIEIELRQHLRVSGRPSQARRVAAMTACRSSVSAASMTSWLCASTAISCCATARSPLSSRYSSVLCRRDISCASRLRLSSSAARSACGT